MKSTEATTSFSPWLPMRFCIALSVITVVQNLAMTVINKSDVGGWSMVFLAFLPMCFYFVGALVTKTQVEISQLKTQIAELKGKSAT